MTSYIVSYIVGGPHRMCGGQKVGQPEFNLETVNWVSTQCVMNFLVSSRNFLDLIAERSVTHAANYETTAVNFKNLTTYWVCHDTV